MFVAAYPRETLEMLLDAHNRAFAFFGGVPRQMVYDNPSTGSGHRLKAVVDMILVGKERKFNRRFLALANHYLFEPVACTPAAGWETCAELVEVKAKSKTRSVTCVNGCSRRAPSSIPWRN